MIRIAFRFDDVSSTSDLTLERQIIEAFAVHGYCATFAAIPFARQNGSLLPLTRERASHLLDALDHDVAEIAVHGYSHERRDNAPDGMPSEFAGLPLSEQRSLIQDGFMHLKRVFGDRIRGFVPPWNSFDAATVEVLEGLAFRYLSAGWDGPTERPGTMALIPRTCNLSGLEEAVRSAARLEFMSPMVIVVMHHYDFREHGGSEVIIDVPTLKRLLGWLAGQAGVAVVSLAEMARLTSRRQWQLGFTYYRLRRRLPWRFQRSIPEGIFITAAPWHLIGAPLSFLRGAWLPAAPGDVTKMIR